MPSSSNLYYPKGYALSVGINDYSQWNPALEIDNLKNCIKDVEFWDAHLSAVRGFEYVVKLRDNLATLRNVICSIWLLAQKAEAGDLVMLHFSTHGTSSSNNNQLLLYPGGEMLNEQVFKFLLKAFKPLVRVYVISDACESGTLVAPHYNDKSFRESHKQQLRNALATLEQSDVEKLDEMLSVCETLPVSASIAHIASVSDGHFVPDGILTALMKSIFEDSYNYTAGEIRDLLDKGYEDVFYDSENGFYGRLLDFALYEPLIPEFLKKEARENETTPEKLIESYMTHLVTFDRLIFKLQTIPVTFYGNGDKVNKYYSFLETFQNMKDNILKCNPVLVFAGKKSEGFEQQVFLRKFSRYYYLENI